ncbi:hypothetical protein E2P84_36555, partial [Burkholderia cepacia]
MTHCLCAWVAHIFRIWQSRHVHHARSTLWHSKRRVTNSLSIVASANGRASQPDPRFKPFRPALGCPRDASKSASSRPYSCRKHVMPITAPITPLNQQSNGQCLLLIDGLNIVRRVYEAHPQPDSREKIEGVVRSSLGSFKRALTEIMPTHALAAFDHGGETWRHRLYPPYRANRKPMPQILRDALPGLYQLLADRLGLTVVSIPDVEAEDVIATCFSRWASSKPDPVVVLSTDKDLAWLMTKGAHIRDHFTPEWR